MKTRKYKTTKFDRYFEADYVDGLKKVLLIPARRRKGVSRFPSGGVGFEWTLDEAMHRSSKIWSRISKSRAQKHCPFPFV